MSAARGKHDGKAFFGCLVLVGLIIAMGNDMAQADAREWAPPRKPPVPMMVIASQDNSVELLASAIMDANALHAPVKRTRIPMPSLGGRP